MSKVPTIGRIVLYVLHVGPREGTPRAAIITHVYEEDTGCVGLYVMPAFWIDGLSPFSVERSYHYPFVDDGEPRLATWDWPDIKG